jgi:eukaryotic-like serine/threonine-protein kinase
MRPIPLAACLSVYAVDANSGALKWKFQTGDVVHASPAAADGTLYVGSWDGFFYALDATTGNERWRYKTGEDHDIYNQVGIQSDLAAQRVAWSFQTNGAKQNGATCTKPDGSPSYEAAFTDFFHDDMVVGMSRMMSVGAVLSSPAIVGHTVYFGSTDGNVYALS